ncbi:hypothetical protein M378DRAFT_867942 [Amanita muscaria Koide BX008]|uniref:Uncharacterized protein n=1 Tax=Amanita muscaria (strain Koide BX008) TaxID=946122 RepID=A0A0C2WWI4_AMAMK|nr:hypothetical protein M378DRAFT_867942 [Amanita muscaria Koide BX008]
MCYIIQTHHLVLFFCTRTHPVLPLIVILPRFLHIPGRLHEKWLKVTILGTSTGSRNIGEEWSPSSWEKLSWQ